MTSASINTLFLEKVLFEDNISHLAVFMKLKSFFSNSCFYGYTYTSMSRKTGMSPSFLKKHIPFFKEKKWVRIHDGNMIFEKMIRIDDQEKKNIVSFRILKSDSWKNILKKLRLLLVKDKHDKFKKYIDSSSDRSSGENKRFSISNKRVGMLIGKSRSTASRLVKWGHLKKILQISPNIKEVESFLSSSPEDKAKLKGGAILIIKDNSKNPFAKIYDCFQKYKWLHQKSNFIRFY